MTDRRDVHAVPFEASNFEHRADRRCKCAPTIRRDLNVPGRVVFVHRIPPIPNPPMKYPGDPIP